MGVYKAFICPLNGVAIRVWDSISILLWLEGQTHCQIEHSSPSPATSKPLHLQRLVAGHMLQGLSRLGAKN